MFPRPWVAYFNLLKLGFGPGFLAIPLAISQAGIFMGPVICIIVSLTLVHTQIMLVRDSLFIYYLVFFNYE